jgi:hypothetical protein
LSDLVPPPPPTPAPTFAPNDWEEWMISTDRNSVTPHPNVVPRGVLQFENGITLEKFHRGGSFNVPETSVRLGVLKWTELRFGVPNYLRSSGTERLEGTSDITVGVKQEFDPPFLKKRGFDFGIIAGMSLPTGSRRLTTRRVDPFVQAVAFEKIGKNWILGTAHSVFTPARATVYQPTAIVYRAFGPRVDLWGEYAANFANRGLPSEQVVDGGILWRPRNKHQFDLRFGFGLTESAPRAFLGVGYSFIIGRLWQSATR